MVVDGVRPRRAGRCPPPHPTVLRGDADHEPRTSDRAYAEAAPGLPTELWVRGREQLDQVTGQAIAIIGTHTSTPYGAHVAADLAYGLAGRDWTIVTTGAFGIDAAALRGALAAGGTAVAVLSSGLDRPFPSAHTQLFDRVAQGGLLVSQLPPAATPTRAKAQVRGRLLVALVRAVVVVEAPLRSSCLTTAQWATTYDRPGMAVPGPVTSTASAGRHRLLRTRTSRLVTGATPQWSRFKQFALTRPDQFGQPTVDRTKVPGQAKKLVDLSAKLTEETKVSAYYWADGPGSELPPGHWAMFAQAASRASGLDLDSTVKVFFGLARAGRPARRSTRRAGPGPGRSPWTGHSGARIRRPRSSPLRSPSTPPDRALSPPPPAGCSCGTWAPGPRTDEGHRRPLRQRG